MWISVTLPRRRCGFQNRSEPGDGMMLSEGCENIEVCRACGGKCCQRYAGTYHPDDLAPVTADTLAERFSSGLYAIDWWEGDVRRGQDEWSISMFVRPAHRGAYELRDPAWEGICIHWDVRDGCCFELQDRPYACRTMEAVEGGHCTGPFDKEAAALAWVPYQRVIKEAEELCVTTR